jgi:hypothetical protein
MSTAGAVPAGAVPAAAARRPTSVLIVLVAAWIQVAMSLIASVALFFMASDTEVVSAVGATTDELRVVAGVGVVFGLIAAAFVLWLQSGSNVAQILVSIVAVLNIGAGVWAIAAAGTHQLAESLVNIGLASVVLVLLWNHAANEYFASD